MVACLGPQFAIQKIFLSPSGVSNSSHNSFIASALVVATAFFAALFACLYLSLSYCLRDASHIFFATFLAFITSCTLPFHHHVSLSPGGVRPVVIPNTSCPTLNIVVLVSSHHSCTLVTPQDVILTQDVIIAARCNTIYARCNNNAKCNNFYARCNKTKQREM